MLRYDPNTGQMVEDGTTSAIGIGLNQPIKVNGYGANTQFQAGVNTDANAAQTVDPTSNLNLNSLAFNNGTGGLAEQGWMSKIGDWFTPQGDKGTSVGGNITQAAGVIGNLGMQGLAAWQAKQNTDLQKDNQQYLRNREAQSDARKNMFASNAGNGASYTL